MKRLLPSLFFLMISFSVFGMEAKLILLNGDVFVNGLEAEENQIVKTGDFIEAKGKESFFKVAYESGTKYLVRDGAMEIIELSEDDSKISLLRGHSFFNVSKKDREHFQVKTRSTSMGVRGTTFYIFEDDKESYLCVCSGIVRVSREDQYIDVFKNQDIHVYSGVGLNKTRATDQMIDFALEEINKL